MLIHIAFDKTLKKHGISGKAISNHAKVSESHISQFRNGKGGDVSSATLERLLDAMEELAPGSKLHFCLLLAGKNPDELEDPDLLISSMDNQAMAKLLNAIASRFLATDQESSGARRVAV